MKAISRVLKFQWKDTLIQYSKLTLFAVFANILQSYRRILAFFLRYYFPKYTIKSCKASVYLVFAQIAVYLYLFSVYIGFPIFDAPCITPYYGTQIGIFSSITIAYVFFEGIKLRNMGLPEQRIQLDLRIARGLDYYTGVVYKTTLDDYPEVGSVCSAKIGRASCRERV